MRARAAVLAAAALLVQTASAAVAKCDNAYDCVWTHLGIDGASYEFDFRNLCESNNFYDYKATDATGHDYYFNVCGLVSRECLPANRNIRYDYIYASVTQFWDPVPPCNTTAPECFDPITQKARCCTSPCETLGVGVPIWSLVDESNPFTGGVQLTYQGVPTPANEAQCPTDKKTGAPQLRDMTIVLNCDPNVPVGELEIDGVNETSTCHYAIYTRTGNACGCKPDCYQKSCGSDGCGGFCSGSAVSGSDTLRGRCPAGQLCLADQTCCRPDCTNRDCGDDGCGNSCGTCGADETCSAAQVCISSANDVPTAAIEYVSDAGGMAGYFFLGIFLSVSSAGAVVFATGSGRVHFDRLRAGGIMALLGKGGAGKEGTSLMASAATGSSAAATTPSRFGGGYGSSSSGGYGAASAAATEL